MGALTEAEIIDCLFSNFRLAAEHCEDLARLPRKGPTYRLLREELKLIEGAAKQLAVWRGNDARWLNFSFMMGEAHQRSGNWLRAHAPARLFLLLAVSLRKGEYAAQQLRDRKTNVMGAIIPAPLPDPNFQRMRTGWTPNQEHRTPGGIILPSGVMAQ